MCRPAKGPAGAASGLTLTKVLEAGLARLWGQYRLSRHQWKILHALLKCRTAALGGHLYRCEKCGAEHFVPHACGNRHCPQCQGAQALVWLARQESVLLPIPYFHVVFTLPHALNGLIRQNQRELFNLLFGTASQTLLQFGRQELGAQIGVTAVLHTWGQTLGDHYHVHCIVTGGGLALQDGSWVKASGHYLFAVRALSKMFGGKFRAGLRALRAQGKLTFAGQMAGLAKPGAWEGWLGELKRGKWVVYAKRPFAGPEQVLGYLSRYTHRVAISNRRLLALEAGTVTFAYTDYAQAGRRRTMQLPVVEFVRRFCLHLLPERFVKIRHYGLLSNRGRQERVQRARESMGVREVPEPGLVTTPAPVNGVKSEAMRCPQCGALALIWVEEIQPQRSAVGPILADSS